MTLTVKHFDNVVLLLSLTLLSFVHLFEFKSIMGLATYGLPFILIWVVIFKNAYNFLLTDVQISKAFNTLFVFLSLYIMLIVFGVVRCYFNGVLPTDRIAKEFNFLITMILFGFALIVGKNNDEVENLKLCLYFSWGLYVVANVLFYMIGIESYYSDVLDPPECRMAASFGIEMYRTMFPLAVTTNGFGVICGVATAAMVMVLTHRHVSVLLRMCAAVIIPFCIFGILGADSRGGTAAMFFAIIGATFYNRTPTLKSLLITIMIPLAPLILGYIQLKIFQFDIETTLSRNESGDIGSGRFIIWAVGVQELLRFLPIHIVGYGYYGHAASGISTQYAFIFRGFNTENEELYGMHNSILQVVIDFGYAGAFLILLLFFLLCRWTLKRINTHKRSMAKVDLAVLIYLAALGTSEPTLLFYNKELFVMFLMTMILSFGISLNAELSKYIVYVAERPVAFVKSAWSR